MSKAVAQLLETLDLERLEQNLFRGVSPQVGWQRVFGGQVVGQSLVAAQRTVEAERKVHSLHGYFLRPGDPSVPIIYEVDRIRDGGRFSTRLVVAIQHGKAIFSMSASFQIPETGLEHTLQMPDVPGPDVLPDSHELAERYFDRAPENVRRYWKRERPIELRVVDPTHYFSETKLDPVQMVWIRSAGPLPEDLTIHQAVLAYASDITLIDTCLFPHGVSIFDARLQAASLDHAIWFHRPFDFTQWHLYAQDSPMASGGRGLNRGAVYTRSGELVASCAQEGLVRLRTPLSRN